MGRNASGSARPREGGWFSKKKERMRTVSDIFIRRVAFLRDAHELVDLVLHASLQHLHFLEDYARFNCGIDAVARAGTASRTVLRAEWSVGRGAVCERMSDGAAGGDEAEGLEVGEHHVVFEREQRNPVARV